MPGAISTAIKTASIVIPTFNGGSRIGNCLDSLVKQTAGRDVEILVVDDGSTDNTADVVRGYSSVRLITQANAGPAAARNHGAMEAQGSILLFTDDDCLPMPDWLEAMVKLAVQPAFGLVQFAFELGALSQGDCAMVRQFACVSPHCLVDQGGGQEGVTNAVKNPALHRFGGDDLAV